MSRLLSTWQGFALLLTMYVLVFVPFEVQSAQMIKRYRSAPPWWLSPVDFTWGQGSSEAEACLDLEHQARAIGGNAIYRLHVIRAGDDVIPLYMCFGQIVKE